ncbi:MULTISPECIES: GNAT family N-acetyltransferase [Alphaproteobacteria]|uniref:GNAT family N-acetyltransferase n=1 Tax=Alphaproteobacteria TaxID=28211 RepID=UPI0032654F88
MTDSITIRRAAREDVHQMFAMVRGLADYVKETHLLRASEEDLLRDGFGPEPRFKAFVADDGTGSLLGSVIYSANYSTWVGRSACYIDDLFVTEAARGKGVGRRLVAAVAADAVAEGHGRISLTVLDWNPAREAYRSLGFEHEENALRYTVSGEALKKLAVSAD